MRRLVWDTCVALIFVLSLSVRAQDACRQSAQTSTSTSAQAQPSTSAQRSQPPSADASQPDSPMSLGDLARLARGKKASQPKAVRIFDDQNMPHAPLGTGETAPGADHGKVTLIDFWASWCGPCRHSLPSLKQLEAAYRGDDFELISFSEDEDENDWHSFTAENGMNWTQHLDVNHQMMRQYGATGLPTYVLIGRDGKVLQQYVGDDPEIPIVERIGPDLKRALNGKS